MLCGPTSLPRIALRAPVSRESGGCNEMVPLMAPIHGVQGRVEMPIPNQDPIGDLYGIDVLIRLGLNFDQVGTNNAITHALVLSATM